MVGTVSAIMAAECSIIKPDCVKCLRKMLRADSIAVFFREGSSWKLGSFQGEKPSADAEVEFDYMIMRGLPEELSAFDKGLLLTSDEDIKNRLPIFANLFLGHSFLSCPIHYNDIEGVRIALRCDQDDAFTEQDLETLRCFKDCPKDCL